ncbi:ankyrin repeat domain-containing protein [Thelonectria olida]|uniref:Ankyrin repeat domain-containing protein n=1 Tax=Thelonectria olida TaxID=1576542 RepID=A0A9P8W8J0_9HYPO|nr:ankyrin repeat domain-containing protein [Thelonectria olida]
MSVGDMSQSIYGLGGTSQSIFDLDLEDDDDFKRPREFLLADSALPTAVSSELKWHRSITTQDAHATLAELCVLYLNLFNSNLGLSGGVNGEAGHSFDRQAFLEYSAQNWGTHFREADIVEHATITPFTLSICDPASRSYSAWFEVYWKTQFRPFPQDLTNLMAASYYGHRAVVNLLIEKGAHIEAKDMSYGQTPLMWAVEGEHETVIKLLLEKGADIEVKDDAGQTSVSGAAVRGHETAVKLLLENGADIEATDHFGHTPLILAASQGHETTVKLLLEKGADINARDIGCCTPLSWATNRGHGAVAKLLLEKGADS